MKSLLTILCLLLLGAECRATVYNCADTTWSVVNSNVLKTVNGDTVNIPAGSSDWSGHQVNLTNHIDVEGAGTNLTLITRNDNNTIFLVDTRDTTRLVTIGNMSLAEGNNTSGANNIIQVGNGSNGGGSSAWVYFHNINFTNSYEAIAGNDGNYGNRLYGCCSTCKFVDPCISISLNGTYDIWFDPIVMGGTNTFVIENCEFVQDANAVTGGNFQEQIQSGHGIKEVVRYCDFNYTNFPGNTVANGNSGTDVNPIEWHGFGGGVHDTPLPYTNPAVYANYYTNNTGDGGIDDPLRGPPTIEVYSNTFRLGANSSSRIIHDRGGSALIYGNTVTTTYTANFLQITCDYENAATIALYGQQFVTWASVDQVDNSFFWSNTVNGTIVTYSYYSNGTFDSTNLPAFMQLGRDLFTNAPAASGQGAVTWSDFPGGHMTTFTSGASAYYPYTPLVYPHPLAGGGLIYTNTVTYNGNGSTGGSVPVDGNSPYTNGATVTVIGNTGGLVYTGKTFSKWNTASDGSGTPYSGGDVFTMPSAAVVLWAIATNNPVAPTGMTISGIYYHP